MNTQSEPGVRVEHKYSTIQTLIDSIHVQVDKAAKQRKRTIVNTFYAASAKILRLWWTLTMIRSLRNQICDLKALDHKEMSSGTADVSVVAIRRQAILILETRITHLINKAL